MQLPHCRVHYERGRFSESDSGEAAFTAGVLEAPVGMHDGANGPSS